MRLITGVDPERNMMAIKFQVGFLDKYYSNLEGLLLNKSSFPDGLELTRCGENEVEITFPIPENAEQKKMTENTYGIMIEDSAGKFQNLNKTINLFINSGMRKELSITEFIPLNGYPQEDLVKDIKESKKNKRNLCIIKDFSEYIRNQESREYKFNQKLVEYGTSEWADIILEILSPDFSLSKLRKKYNNQLELVCWL